MKRPVENSDMPLVKGGQGRLGPSLISDAVMFSVLVVGIVLLAGAILL